MSYVPYARNYKGRLLLSELCSLKQQKRQRNHFINLDDYPVISETSRLEWAQKERWMKCEMKRRSKLATLF